MVLSIMTTGAMAKTINVGTNAEFAPFEFMDKDTKEIAGFDIDLINAIIKTTGNTTNIMNMGFDGLIPALKTNTIDVAATGMTITEARKKQVNFSDPYYHGGLVILIQKKDENLLKTIKDLEGKKLCAQIGTTGAIEAKKIKNAKVKEYNGLPEAFMDLSTGGCNAVIGDKPVVDEYLKVKGSGNLKVFPQMLNSEYLGFAVNKKNTQLLKQINEGLKKVKESGEYDKIYAKWFN